MKITDARVLEASPLSKVSLLFLWDWIRRDFRIRYTQTSLGVLWALLQPLALTAIFVVIFSRIARIPTAVPYASFVLPGMLAWSLFSNGLNNGISAMSGSMHIASNVNYPRAVAPLSAAILPVVDLAAGSLVLPVLFAIQGTRTNLNIPLLIYAIVGCLFLSAGLGSLIGALAVFIRDVRQALPLVLQVLLLATPVAYPRDRLPAFLSWNPMGVFVEAFRSAVVDIPGPSAASLAASLALATGILALGLWYVGSVQDRFTDVA